MAKKKAESVGDATEQNKEVIDLFEKFPECNELYRIPTGEYFTHRNMAQYAERDFEKIETFLREDFFTAIEPTQPVQEPSAE